MNVQAPSNKGFEWKLFVSSSEHSALITARTMISIAPLGFWGASRPTGYLQSFKAFAMKDVHSELKSVSK